MTLVNGPELVMHQLRRDKAYQASDIAAASKYNEAPILSITSGENLSRNWNADEGATDSIS